MLCNAIIGFALGLIEGLAGQQAGMGMLSGLYTVAIFIPSIAVAVRRLHDTDRSGWWVLLGLIPILGALVLLVFFVQDSTPGENRFGPNPKEIAAS